MNTFGEMIKLGDLPEEQKAEIKDLILYSMEHEGEFYTETNKEPLDANKTSMTYTRSYLPEIDKTSDRYKIVLEDTVSSARISIDGELVATVGMTPMETIVSGEKFNKQGIIEITVANTAANEIISKKYLIEKHSSMTIGPYHWHERSLQFEKNAYIMAMSPHTTFLLFIDSLPTSNHINSTCFFIFLSTTY